MLGFDGRACRVLSSDLDHLLGGAWQLELRAWIATAVGASLLSGDRTVPKAELMPMSKLDRAPHAITGGVLLGFAAGVLVLGAYFVQASWGGTGGLFWDVFVIPALAILFAGALVAAAASSEWRRWWVALPGGCCAHGPALYRWIRCSVRGDWIRMRTAAETLRPAPANPQPSRSSR